MLPALCLLLSSGFAQDIVVSGTVTDVKGETLPGVSITVQGANTGRVTDENGKFSIPVSNPSAVLTFTYIGFVKIDRPVGNNRILNVVMQESTNDLQEVVVVGFGTQTKAEQTAAISSIKAEDIIKAPVGNVTNALTGRMSGVITRQPQGRPGLSEAQIYIRGRVSENSSALIIVDGVERESFGDIDANEIQNISILKDAASTALFGLKGANGVIVVTTKRGKVGKTQISYSGGFGLSTFGQRPETLGAYESAMLHNEGEQNMIKIGQLQPSQLTFTAEDIETFRRGDGDPLLYPDVNWYDALTRNVWARTNHNLNFTGGSKKAAYFISLGYTFEDGAFKQMNPDQNFATTPSSKRTNFRSNLDYNLTKTTKLTLNLAGRIENEYTPRFPNGQLDAEDAYLTGAEGLLRQLQTIPNWAIPYFPEYNARSNPEMIALDNTYNKLVSVGFGSFKFNNPYSALISGGGAKSDRNTLESIFVVEQELGSLTKGLSLRGTFAYDQSSYGTQILTGASRLYQVNRSTGQFIDAYPSPNQYQIDDPLNDTGNGSGGRYKTNLQLQLNYQRQFGSHKASGALVGTREYRPLSSDEAPVVFQGLVFKTGYNYEDKYFVAFNGSYQGSENFGEGYRYGFFPTVSAGYSISSEKFMAGIKERIKLDYLKIRGSYGLTGFSNAGRFLYQDEYSGLASNVYFGNPSNLGSGRFDPREGQYGATHPTAGKIPLLGHSRFGNPFVTFEKGLKRDLGIDATFFNNRIQITADIADEKRYDILLSRAKSTLLSLGERGTGSYNYGENYNSGYEFEIQFNNSNKRSFGYGLSFNFSHYKNKYVIVDEPINEPLQNFKIAGSAINQYRGYATNGFYQSEAEVNAGPIFPGFPHMPGDIKLVDLDGDGVIGPNDVTNIGYSDVPVDNYGAAPYIRFKNWNLSALFQAADKVSNELHPNDNVVQYFVHQLDRWTPENTDAKFPAIRPGSIGGRNQYYGNGRNFNYNSFNLQDASYIKLRNVQLAYRVPDTFARKIGMTNLNLVLVGQNLYTWTKFIGFDPENTGDKSVGFYANPAVTYPNIRTFQFNVRASF